MKVLVIDIGGTRVKLWGDGRAVPVRFNSGPTMTPAEMVVKTRELTRDWDFDVISMGYPGPVREGRILKDPYNLGPGWYGFDFESALGKPVKIINDAAMQALGAYQGGRMLFLGFGTGMGSTLIADTVILPLELGHLPYKKKKTYEDYVGVRGQKKRGKKKWRKDVQKVVTLFANALLPDEVVLGGGEVKNLKRVPAGCRLVTNADAAKGGLRLWEVPAQPATGEPQPVHVAPRARPAEGRQPGLH